MTALDRLITSPRLIEITAVDLSEPPACVWQLVRHGNLPHSPVVRALFALRTLVSRANNGGGGAAPVRLDSMTSSPERPGFQILADDPPREVVVGAIGKVWRLNIPFVHVRDAEGYARFAEPGYVKVAWAIRVSPVVAGKTRLELDVRVQATDDGSWRRFWWYLPSHRSRVALHPAIAASRGPPHA